MKYLIYLYILWNMVVFLLYGYDKWQSKRGGWRVPEKTLLLCAFLLGAVGAYVGMQSFRHKTKHASFVIGVPLCIAVNFAFIYLLARYVLS